jgi:hypothetical protein
MFRKLQLDRTLQTTSVIPRFHLLLRNPNTHDTSGVVRGAPQLALL